MTAEPTLESARAHAAEARRKYDRDPRELGPTTAGKLLADLEWACEQVERLQNLLTPGHPDAIVDSAELREILELPSYADLEAKVAEQEAEIAALNQMWNDQRDALERLRRVEQMARDFSEYWIACRIREGDGPYFEDLAPLDAAAAELRVVLGETETP